MEIVRDRIWKLLMFMWFIAITPLVSMAIAVMPVYDSSTMLSVDPPIIVDTDLDPGSTFHINVTVADVSALWGFQFNLTYDTSVLTATAYSAYSPFVLPWPSEINDAEGWVDVAYSMPFGETEGFSTVDPAPIARIDFTVDEEGDSLLDLQQANVDSILSDVNGVDISHENVNGYFSNLPPAVQYTLTIAVDGFGTTNPAPGDHLYDAGVEVEVDAIPDSGYMLDHWELDGVDAGSADPITVNMDADHALTAFFVEVGWTVLSVDPPSIINEALTPGSTFSIDVTVADVSAMWGYEFVLSYDTGILTATAYSSYDPFVLSWPSEINDAEGWVDVAYSMVLGETEGFSTVDPAPIARIDFEVDSEGESLLDLHDTKISDIYGDSIPHDANDGYFNNVAAVIINADVNMNPNTLSLMSRGRWITAFIQLPEGYNVGDIDVSSIRLDDTIPVDFGAPTIARRHVLRVRFSRGEVLSYILEAIDFPESARFIEVSLTITGELIDGTPFESSDTIRIVIPRYMSGMSISMQI